MKPAAPKRFQEALLGWYRRHGRDLPWRQTADPYHVLVSELMLQQTQVDRVIPKYFAFLERFPTVQALAEAPQGEVLRMWAGLGYNSRAMRLHKLAQVVCQEYGGKIPTELEILRGLPGVGAYTAGAVRTFGHRLPASFIDINIKRILHRVFVGPEYPQWQKSDKEMDALAAELVPADEGYDYHQGLMDVGALFCGAKSTDCAACPLAGQCKTRMALEAMPLLLTEARKIKRLQPKEPFRESMRFLRGRIVDKLRHHEGGLTEHELHAELTALDVPRLERLPDALRALTEEGLLHRAGQIYRL